MTVLAELIRSKIATSGPISMAEYMSHCLGHPEHGYYMTRDPLGVRGDFTTSPEISQMFGEMLGAWLMQTWVDHGRPTPFVLAEAGPGRGTLMRDILRVAAILPRFLEGAHIHLIEISPTLRDIQAETLKGHDITWCGSLDDLPSGPAFLVANEFFDALPVHQFQRTDALWRERLVFLRDGGLQLTWSEPKTESRLNARFPHAADGTIVEVCPAGERIMFKLSERIANSGGGALIVDYGTWDGTGDTLQALAGHAPTDPLFAPGQADITAHVRFKGLADMATGAKIHGPVPQGVFLERLGITARAQALAAKQCGEAHNSIVTAHRRLTHPDEMGNHFQVMGLTPNAAPAPPGF
ncbi:class I SAM-dependent methyltransferase [Amaricoccus tamworthensis]|uniref:class I SAM-dependent methyltransferase n=1 Tax=Amaricoccus tamworthensis TaxID=57002 RepID=UPI003C798186